MSLISQHPWPSGITMGMWDYQNFPRPCTSWVVAWYGNKWMVSCHHKSAHNIRHSGRLGQSWAHQDICVLDALNCVVLFLYTDQLKVTETESAEPEVFPRADLDLPIKRLCWHAWHHAINLALKWFHNWWFTVFCNRTLTGLDYADSEITQNGLLLTSLRLRFVWKVMKFCHIEAVS